MAACGAGDPAAAGWAGSIDTFVDGVVVVHGPTTGEFVVSHRRPIIGTSQPWPGRYAEVRRDDAER